MLDFDKKRGTLKGLGISVIGGMILFSCAGQRPENLGIANYRLADCPTKPNCVTSQGLDQDHFLAPLKYAGEKNAAIKRLKKGIASFERMTIITESDNYLHIECRSAIIGFVDDLEFYFPEEKLIHFRSASRLGYSDLGVNQKRVEQIRRLLAE